MSWLHIFYKSLVRGTMDRDHYDVALFVISLNCSISIPVSGKSLFEVRNVLEALGCKLLVIYITLLQLRDRPERGKIT